MNHTISQTLESFLNDDTRKSSEAWQKACFYGLNPQEIEQLSGRYQVYEGKVRQCLTDGSSMTILHTDRLTAFDRHIDYVPFKGMILSAISKFWFELARKTLPTHYLNELNARTLKVKSLSPIKVEVVVRGYLAGSMMRAYEKGEREFCGNHLPKGLKPFQPLEKPIITPTTKAEAFDHDEETTPAELIAKGICSEEEWHQVEKLALELFKLGQEVYSQKGWILADTKYEFGKDESGNIYIIDEIHTPDSSRLWVQNTYLQRIENAEAPTMLDKENVRRFLINNGFQGVGEVPDVPERELIALAQTYLQVAETLIGKKLEANTNISFQKDL